MDCIQSCSSLLENYIILFLISLKEHIRLPGFGSWDLGPGSCNSGPGSWVRGPIKQGALKSG